MSATADLILSRDRIATRISEYALALANDTTAPKSSYTLDNKTVDRNGWRTSISNTIAILTKQIAELNQTINAMNPYVISTKMVS